ncbi:hypothetical protein DICA1_E30218 [Diutina catenulata]
MLFSLVVFQSLVVSLLAKHITEETISQGEVDIKVDDLTIDPNTYWAVFDNKKFELDNGHGAGKQLTVGSGAGLYLVGTVDSSLSVEGDFTNKGTIVVDSTTSGQEMKHSAIAKGNFLNSGEMFFRTTGEQGSSLTTKIRSQGWLNNGFITFSQPHRNDNKVDLGANVGVIHNDGDICLFNYAYPVQTDLIGPGCVHIYDDSVVDFSPVKLSEHTVQFAPGSTGFIMTGAPNIYHHFITVRGYGEGMAIASLKTINRYTYTGSILTLETELGTAQYDIGLGYDFSKFYLGTREFSGSSPHNAIEYRGAVPSQAAVDPKCGHCKRSVDVPSPHPDTSSTNYHPDTSSTNYHPDTSSTNYHPDTSSTNYHPDTSSTNYHPETTDHHATSKTTDHHVTSETSNHFTSSEMTCFGDTTYTVRLPAETVTVTV